MSNLAAGNVGPRHGCRLASAHIGIFAGSLAPVIAVALLQRTHSTTPIAAYLALACLVSAIAALTARETRGLSFAELDAPRTSVGG